MHRGAGKQQAGREEAPVHHVEGQRPATLEPAPEPERDQRARKQDEPTRTFQSRPGRCCHRRGIVLGQHLRYGKGGRLRGRHAGADDAEDAEDNHGKTEVPGREDGFRDRNDAHHRFKRVAGRCNEQGRRARIPHVPDNESRIGRRDEQRIVEGEAAFGTRPGHRRGEQRARRKAQGPGDETRQAGRDDHREVGRGFRAWDRSDREQQALDRVRMRERVRKDEREGDLRRET